MQELAYKFLRKDYLTSDNNFFYAQIAVNIGLLVCCIAPWLREVSLALIYLSCATPTIIRSIQQILNKKFSIDALMTTAGIASFAIGNHIESALLFVLFRISNQLESNIKKMAYKSFKKSSLKFQMKTWIKASDGSLVPRHLDDIAVGSLVIVKGGEIFPLDGVIVEGHTQITTAHITGESETFEKKENDHILSGSQNVGTSVVLKTTRTRNQSTLEKIFHLIHAAQENKPNMQTFFERIQIRYSSCIIFTCLCYLLFTPHIIGISYLGESGSIQRSLNMLIALSPCSILLAIPICYVSSLSCFAKKGVLIKNTKSIETLSKTKKIAIDKTGTLTNDRPNVNRIFCISTNCQQENPTSHSINITYQLAKQVVHPNAAALVTWCENKNASASIHMDSIKTVSGQEKGVCASINDGIDTVALGNYELIAHFISAQTKETIKNIIHSEGLESICLSFTSTQCLLFELHEAIRPGAVGLANSLSNMNITTVVLTGDREKSAKKVCEQLGPCNMLCDLSPSDKLNAIQSLKQEGVIVMVGDGINDSPALACADVSIAMGGSNNNAIAAENSDIILINNCLKNLPWMITKSKQTRNIIFQNLALSAASIIVGAFLAVNGLSSIWFAVMLHEGATIVVSLNGTRLLW